ncbi:hypothetical protein B566_EDAN005082 [Ephemera danica]|nr:hypothetical protein B566_EDAN005082 [Ephemera danica]
MALTGCYAVLKYIVVILNLIFWLAGLAVLSIAVWLLADPNFYMQIIHNNASSIGLYVLLGVGVLMFVVGFLGCSGAYRESQCMLVSFFCFLLIILVAEIAAGAWAYSHSHKLEDMIKSSITDTVKKEYSVTEENTSSFDNLQRALQCCGSMGPTDWSNSAYNNKTSDEHNKKEGAIDMTLRSAGTYHIPKSCCNIEPDTEQCKKDTIGVFGGIIQPTIYSEGCATTLIALLEEYSNIALAICVGFVILELMGLIFSIILCCAIRAVESYKA